MTDPADNGLVSVRLLQLPVPVWARAQEQHDALLRDFALMVPPSQDEQARHVPSRLIELVTRLGETFDGTFAGQKEDLAQAVAQGVDALDLTYRIPVAVAPAARQLGALLDEADTYCRQGRHLLTLAPDEELVRFRWWYLGQFTGQATGQQAVAWPDYQPG